MRKTVVVRHLRMRSESKLSPSPERPEMRFEEAEVPSPELNRFFYTTIGGPLYWMDRLGWSHGEWRAYLEAPGVETWVGRVGGNPVGYVELKAEPPDAVRIAYFGVLPAFQGQGYGGDLLTRALRRCWSLEPEGVLVSTCSLDGPHALENYLARGFEMEAEEREERELPDEPPDPWAGARAGAS